MIYLNKKYLILLIINIILSLTCAYTFYKKLDNEATTIFHDTVNSVVELKATEGNRESFGTAVFIGDENRLITNAHVVLYNKRNKKKAYKSLQVRFANESKYRNVSLEFYDEKMDIALLDFKESSKKIKGLKTRNSDHIDFGETVYAIGNSMNNGISISQGIIGIPKIIIEYNGESRKSIQADLTISSGNSGGALLDQNGKIIGITTFRTKDENGNIVYGNAYAIPINDVLNYIEKQHYKND